MAKIRQTSISVSPDFHRVTISQSQTRQHVQIVLVLMVEWSDSNSDAYCLLWSQVVQKQAKQPEYAEMDRAENMRERLKA